VVFILNEVLNIYQLSVGLVVIDPEFGREDYGSIPTTAIRKGLKPLENQKKNPNICFFIVVFFLGVLEPRFRNG
jgi:hypothetical protein